MTSQALIKAQHCALPFIGMERSDIDEECSALIKVSESWLVVSGGAVG